ncbi:MAG: GTPase/DUF3482 domain-containing protein [Nevskiales bacterium]|nr:GTPase/DUF3482 domain-containing protein [Nevskiales bacterium]
MKPEPIQLAVVGHTNTGKTSLLRTLTRDSAFGQVSDRPATTRDVHGAALLADGEAIVALYDTPGLEDAMGLSDHLAAQHATAVDPVARIEAFLGGDHDHGRYEQEAKVLRQMLRSDAALYVIDAREPVLARHREELTLLAACGRPLMPLLNFVAAPEADIDGWRRQLARMGLHVLAEFDTVVYDDDAERQIFEKLAVLLEAHGADFQRLLRAREQQRAEQIGAAGRAIATLLINVAGLRIVGAADTPADALTQRLRDSVARAEQACVDDLLELFRFDLQTYSPPRLPLEQNHWHSDPFDPETLRAFGVRAGSAAAAGGMAGLAVDSLTGGLSLGAATALGAGLGAAWSGIRTFGRPLLDRLRGHQILAVEPVTLALLAARQSLLLQALLRRGHASADPLHPSAEGGWPSDAVRSLTLRCRPHPEWSALNPGADQALPPEVVSRLGAALLASLPAAPARRSDAPR